MNFLNRAPDVNGLNYWVGQISSCNGDANCIDIKRQNVSVAFLISVEFQQTGFLVYKLYKASFGNIAGTPVPVRFSDFLPDVQTIGAVVIVGQTGWEQKLEQNKQQFINAFINRSQFKNQYPAAMTPAQYVGKLNQNADNSLSTDQRNQLVAGLQNRTETRARAAESGGESDLHK